ncbi:MAG: winged helix-turn-helix domain-containing protein [Gammaproteobacteria bacterium]|nr:winged helix-turn-helix domain-containing protein [Gammaproteobacteria bacterium]
MDDVTLCTVRVYTLGRFSLVLRLRQVIFSGKTQKKPFELLKALISLGGREVSQSHLIDVLWSDSEGDLGRHNLKATVYRLRKLLEPDVLQWQDGKLTLDPARCWVDVWALERRVNHLLHSEEEGLEALDSELNFIIDTYHGPFLQGDDEPYVLHLRERVRSKVLRVLSRSAERFSQYGAYAQALSAYQKGLEIEPLAETFYRGEMLCFVALGRPAEALLAYEHYRQVLHQALGISPSPGIAEFAANLRASSICLAIPRPEK